VKLPGQVALSAGEKPVWAGRQSYKAHVGPFVVGAVVLSIGGWMTFSVQPIGPVIGGLLVFLALLAWLSIFITVQRSEYFISNRRVFIRQGILGRRTHELRIEWVTGSIPQQGLMGKLLNYGSLVFTEVGIRGITKIDGLSDYLEIKELVDNLIEDNKRRS
jgi:hypothetical protein